jgi:hypothetical protein
MLSMHPLPAPMSDASQYTWPPPFVQAGTHSTDDCSHYHRSNSLSGEEPKRSSTDAGWTALHVAARNGQIEVAQLLIESGASVNALTQVSALRAITPLTNVHLSRLA